MKIAFTICSNNYLAQASVLFKSLLSWNKDYKFYIALVDELDPEIDYKQFEPALVTPISQIGIQDFETISSSYGIVELNTALKPSFFKYIFNQHKGCQTILYFDPDIKIYGELAHVEKTLIDNAIVLTPHIYSPISIDGRSPGENTFLNYGIYNLGFLGINPNLSSSIEMLEWWEERTHKLGYDKVWDGIFVDQLWMNHTPLFFDKVVVLRNYGYNVAPWNMHERKYIELQNGKYYMSDGNPLIFYHFSSYRFKSPDVFSIYYNRYSFDNLPNNIRAIYNDYHQDLLDNRISFFSTRKCAFIAKDKNIQKEEKSTLKKIILNITPPILLKGLKRIFKYDSH